MAFAGTVLPSQRDVELSQALFAFPTCGWLLILAERFPTTEIVQKARTGLHCLSLCLYVACRRNFRKCRFVLGSSTIHTNR